MHPPAAQILDYGPPSALAIAGTDLKPQQAAASATAATAAPRYEGLVPIRMMAAFFVVLNHTTYLGLNGAPQNVSNFMAVVNDMAWRVPFFLMLAGFLFARSTQDKSVEKLSGQCAKSARRVLILLLGWSVMHILNPPFKSLFQWDVPGIVKHYSDMWSTKWPSVLWLGPSYHLWFLVSMVMVWLLLGTTSKMWPGLRDLVNDRTARPLLWSGGMLLTSGFVAWTMPPNPMTPGGQLLEVIVAHAILPCSFVLVGAALWHHRHWLTKPATLITALALGALLLVAEARMALSLDGPGPRNLSASGLCLALAALGAGLRIRVKTLSPIWSLSPGIYCAHILMINRLEPLFVNVNHWSSSILLACAGFVGSLVLCHILSLFDWSRRFVK